jgi:hypothetical protein
VGVIGLVQKRQHRNDEKQGQEERSHARRHRQTTWSKFGKRFAWPYAISEVRWLARSNTGD